MAKAIDFKKVVVETVTLELTGEEASTLLYLCNNIAGNPTNSPRGHIDNIAGVLKEIGVTAPSSKLDVRLHTGEFCFLSNPIKALNK